MADTKISALPASTTPLAGTEVLPIVQSGVTKQVSVANLTAGRAISATQLTLTTGNLIVASGQGIDFSATSHPAGMTSELLNDYEEGTWTPTYDAAGATFVYGAQVGTYVKIGSRVFCTVFISTAAGTTAGSGGYAGITGLPYAPSGLFNVRAGFGIGSSSGFLANTPSGITIVEGQAKAFLNYKTLANGNSADLNSANFTSGAGNEVWGSFWYYV
jgi:hypothetical protein